MSKKEKPCKLCELHQKVVVDSNRYTGETVAKFDSEENELLISYDSEQAWTGMGISYCPLCGKKIKPIEIWYICNDGYIRSASCDNDWSVNKAIGNYFETREEAEKAVEKLKALQRLKPKALSWKVDPVLKPYTLGGVDYFDIEVHFQAQGTINSQDLDLLFGEENETTQ